MAVAPVTSPTREFQLGKGRERDLADHKGEEDRVLGDAVLVRLGQLVAEHLLVAECVRQPSRGSQVDQPGIAGGDDGVDQEYGRQPAGADGDGEGVVGAEVSLTDGVGPALGQVLRIQAADEGHLQRDVHRSADAHRRDDCPREILTRVARLSRHLHRLFETL